MDGCSTGAVPAAPADRDELTTPTGHDSHCFNRVVVLGGRRHVLRLGISPQHILAIRPKKAQQRLSLRLRPELSSAPALAGWGVAESPSDLGLFRPWQIESMLEQAEFDQFG